MNGFPIRPSKQEQEGMWFTVTHCVFSPQVPGQGSKHLFLIHALSWEQSMLITHSGLHPLYGSPWYSGKQLQTPLLH